MNFDLELLSRYRINLMGIAAILILLCHSHYCIEFPDIIKPLVIKGNLGVDVFLVLSGIGLYFSLSKRETTICHWYIRRYLRIGIPFLIIIGAEYLFAFFHNEISFTRFLFALSTLGYWFHHEGAWFVSLLTLLYFFSPLLFMFRNKEYGIYLLSVVLVVTVCVGSINIPNDNNFFLYNFAFAIQRVPSFIIGFIIAPWVITGRQCNFVFLSITGLILKVILNRYCGVLGSASSFTLVIPLCICMCYFCKFLEYSISNLSNLSSNKYPFLSFMGRISLESYLANSLLLHIVLTCSFTPSFNGYFVYLFILIFGTIIASIVHDISNKLIKKTQDKK